MGVSLQQLVNGGYIEASHVPRPWLRGVEVTIPLKDDNPHPHGPSILLRTPDGSTGVLLADGSIRDWAEYSRTTDMLVAAEKGVGKSKGGSEFDSLVVELIQIGREIEDPEYSSSGFLRKRDSVEDIDHPRAKEIGRRLYEMGGRKLDLMRKANEMVGQALGSDAASCLDCCWSGIGEADWRAGKGEWWQS